MVNKSFQRVDDLERQIKNARLPYEAWKVLFTIDKQMNLEQIAEFLEEEQTVVNEALERLLNEHLIIAVEIEEEESPVQPEDVAPQEQEAEESAEPPQEQEPEETIEPVEEQEAEAVAESLKEAETLAEEEPEESAEETIEETVTEAPPVKAEEEEAESIIEEIPPEAEAQTPESAETEELQESAAEEIIEQMAEETALPEETAEETPAPESELEININDEDEDISALDVDFGAEAAAEPETAQEVAPEEPPLEEPPAKTGKKTILVVDDSIVIRKMVEIALEEENYNLQTAVSGKEGLDKLDSTKPDLVILDLMLPDINGIDILKAVKAGHKIPVIMLSGKDSPQMVEKAKTAGADAFLPKPFKDEELREQIKTLIAND